MHLSPSRGASWLTLPQTTRKAYKSLKCVAITPSQLQDHGLAAMIPFCKSKHIFVYPSLSGGDSIITHDENVPKHTVQVSVKFENDTAPDAVYDGCVTKFFWENSCPVDHEYPV